jgi:membrane protease YdiL (CAAX protease family)
MNRINFQEAERRTWGLRVAALLAVLLALVVNRQPQWWLNDHVREWFHHPRYHGPWLLVEHLFLSCALPMLVSVLAWLALARAHALVPPRRLLVFDRPRALVGWGLAAGLLPVAFNCAIFYVLLRAGKLHHFSFGWTPPSGWSLAGNAVSNFYEEFVFRGFILVALRYATGSRVLAALLSSVAFGWGHSQYPVEEQLIIGACSLLWCWIVMRTRSLWPVYIGHMIIDLIMDSIIKVG